MVTDHTGSEFAGSTDVIHSPKTSGELDPKDRYELMQVGDPTDDTK